MSNGDAAWDALLAELDRWGAAGSKAAFWLRDDDAVAATPALHRLLDLAAGHGVPLMLAVIPMRVEASLSHVLGRVRDLTIAMHGAWHRNHAPAARKAEETAAERGADAISRELAAARVRLMDAFGAGSGAWYVPPWNRISPPIAALLPGLGFRALSGFGPRPVLGQPDLQELPATIDIIDWHNGRAGRPEAWLAGAVLDQLAAQRRAGAARPIGILSHHLVHDATAWAGLRRLLQVVAQHEAAAWMAAGDLLPATRGHDDA